MKFVFLSQSAHLALDPSAPRAAGGAELQAALMARELARLGHVAVLLGADTGQPDGAKWQGVTIRKAGRFDTGRLDDTLRAWPTIHGALRRERPDFVVVYGWTALLYALALWRRVVPFRLVFVCALDAEIDGDFRKKNPLRGFLFHRGMRSADVRCSITSSQAGHFFRQGMDCTVVRLLLQGAPETVAAKKDVDLLWVARCEDVKRPGLFLDLAQQMPEAACRMVCSAHSKKLFNEIKNRAAAIPNLQFVEGVAYRDIQGEFDRAKIFVNTSSHEGVPNTFLHAGLGKTAIASLEIDPDRMFGEFAAGIMAGGNFADLCAGVRRLLNDDAMLRASAAESLRHVLQRHENTANVEAFVSACIAS